MIKLEYTFLTYYSKFQWLDYWDDVWISCWNSLDILRSKTASRRCRSSDAAHDAFLAEVKSVLEVRREVRDQNWWKYEMKWTQMMSWYGMLFFLLFFLVVSGHFKEKQRTCSTAWWVEGSLAVMNSAERSGDPVEAQDTAGGAPISTLDAAGSREVEEIHLDFGQPVTTGQWSWSWCSCKWLSKMQYWKILKGVAKVPSKRQGKRAFTRPSMQSTCQIDSTEVWQLWIPELDGTI